jgi:hypothetical protein
MGWLGMRQALEILGGKGVNHSQGEQRSAYEFGG